MQPINTIRVEKLARREDGVIVEYAEPVRCDCCGKVCTVRVHHMSNGGAVGRDCATVIEYATSYDSPRPAGDLAALHGANKKQIAYLRALGCVA